MFSKISYNKAMPKKRLTGKDLIGYRVDIKNSNPTWAGFWGYIKDFDGDVYHVTGGAIGNSCPIFSRDEFIVRLADRLPQPDQKA